MRNQKNRARFVICLRNDGADDLEPRKVYQVMPDPDAAREGLKRIVDESGEDYLYPAEYFAPVRLPVAVSRGLFSSARRGRQGARRVAAR